MGAAGCGSGASTQEGARGGAIDRPMRLRYGVNEAHGWRQFALGPGRERIWARLREVDTKLIGISVFDRYTPNPSKEWPGFRTGIEAILQTGAVPVITFAQLRPPVDDPVAVRWFAERCADVVWSCIEEWGGERVRAWYWCVWNNPNSDWVSPGLTFEAYRRIYLDVAEAVLRWLGPHLAGGKPRIGGPAVDTFQPFWFDWIWRFIHEIDNTLIGFAAWHQYGDWRAPGEWGAPEDERIYRGLLLARDADITDRAETIGRVLRGRDILNVCSEVNVLAHHEPRVSRGFNQTPFGAAYYASVLLRLMRTGADAEMFWTGTDAGPYGLWDEEAVPTPVFYAKRLCTQYLREGDWLSFPPHRHGRMVGVVIARGADGRRSALIVHRQQGPARYALAELTGNDEYDALVMVGDGSGGPQIRRCDGEVRFDGYDLAVATTHVVEG